MVGTEHQRFRFEFGGCFVLLLLTSPLAPLAAEQDGLDRLGENVHVEEERHVLDVVQVELQFAPRFLDAGRVRVHDLRHSYASFLINNGRTLYEVQRLLGHSQIKTTQRYAHLSPETLMAASNAASLAIGDLTGALPKAGEKMVSVRG